MTVCICSGVSSPSFVRMPSMNPSTFSRMGDRTSNAFAPVCASCAAPFAFSLSISSLTSLRLLTVSSDMISPAACASSPNAFRACPPSSTMPANSSAERPKTAIAAASRSVSLSILPNASRVSKKISLMSLNVPSAFFVFTPSFLSSSESLETAFFNLRAEPTMSSRDTSTRSEAYWNF